MYGWLARQIAQLVHTYLVAESKLKSSIICRWIKECNSIPLLKARKCPISKRGWVVSVGCIQGLRSMCFCNSRKGRVVQVPPWTFTWVYVRKWVPALNHFALVPVFPKEEILRQTKTPKQILLLDFFFVLKKKVSF